MLFDIIIVSAVVLLTFAVLSRQLLVSAIALAGASILTSIIYFLFNAMWVAVFELTVVAGLVTVLFISAISLTRDLKEELDTDRPLIFFPIFFALVVFGGVLILRGISGSLPDKALGAVDMMADFRIVFWEQRRFDILAQLMVILGGVFGLAAFFRILPGHLKAEDADDGAVGLTDSTTKE